jgi:hypothetical protein
MIGKRVLRVFVVLWMTAVGGILGANFLAIIGTQFFSPDNKGDYVQPWSHAGWYAGTLLFFIAAVTGRLRFINGTGLGSPSTLTTDNPTTSIDRAAVSGKTERYKEPGSALGFVFAGGLAGGIVGFLIGANLLIFWFSLAYSPFAPKQVVSSVEVFREQRPGSVLKRPVMRSSHPVSLYICLTPAAIGILAGATAAGVISLKYREEAEKSEISRTTEKL